MLVLSRKKDEAIMIGDQIEVIVLSVEGEVVRIGLKAPLDQTITRKELIISENEENEENQREEG
ncbi:carbon storage regulator [Paenibacillus mucilaginosus]|uniref:carbon storage regulator n=1 Tax=Paenibacillus mucilaginosus TaxID=61624 RepID=UPI003D1BFD34